MCLCVVCVCGFLCVTVRGRDLLVERSHERMEKWIPKCIIQLEFSLLLAGHQGHFYAVFILHSKTQ